MRCKVLAVCLFMLLACIVLFIEERWNPVTFVDEKLGNNYDRATALQMLSLVNNEPQNSLEVGREKHVDLIHTEAQENNSSLSDENERASADGNITSAPLHEPRTSWDYLTDNCGQLDVELLGGFPSFFWNKSRWMRFAKNDSAYFAKYLAPNPSSIQVAKCKKMEKSAGSVFAGFVTVAQSLPNSLVPRKRTFIVACSKYYSQNTQKNLVSLAKVIGNIAIGASFVDRKKRNNNINKYAEYVGRNLCVPLWGALLGAGLGAAKRMIWLTEVKTKVRDMVREEFTLLPPWDTFHANGAPQCVMKETMFEGTKRSTSLIVHPVNFQFANIGHVLIRLSATLMALQWRAKSEVNIKNYLGFLVDPNRKHFFEVEGHLKNQELETACPAPDYCGVTFAFPVLDSAHSKIPDNEFSHEKNIYRSLIPSVAAEGNWFSTVGTLAQNTTHNGIPLLFKGETIPRVHSFFSDVVEPNELLSNTSKYNRRSAVCFDDVMVGNPNFPMHGPYTVWMEEAFKFMKRSTLNYYYNQRHYSQMYSSRRRQTISEATQTGLRSSYSLRVLIIRRTKSRHIIDHDQILEAARMELGFILWEAKGIVISVNSTFSDAVFEGMSFQEQVQTVAEADIVVAVHGAALLLGVLMEHCGKYCMMVEFTPPGWQFGGASGLNVILDFKHQGTFSSSAKLIGFDHLGYRLGANSRASNHSGTKFHVQVGVRRAVTVLKSAICHTIVHRRWAESHKNAGKLVTPKEICRVLLPKWDKKGSDLFVDDSPKTHPKKR